MVYNYTIPRRPIAAMYSSPGPCYGLPGLLGQINHDPSSTHPRAPGYHMGKRLYIDPKLSGPGPKYFPNPKYLRTGLDAPPAYSHSFRPKDLKKDIGPGPADYSLDGYRPDCVPKYSFGIKHLKEKNYNNPAPNEYILPRMTGGKVIEGDKKSAPSFSMVSRHHTKAYISQWGSRKSAPKFSFGMKHSNYEGAMIIEPEFGLLNQ